MALLLVLLYLILRPEGHHRTTCATPPAACSNLPLLVPAGTG